MAAPPGQCSGRWTGTGWCQGLALKTRSNDDAARLSGWLGADWGDWQLQQTRLSLPVALVADHIPQGSADGRVDATLMQITLGDGKIKQLQGTLQYGGGTVSWGAMAPQRSRCCRAV